MLQFYMYIVIVLAVEARNSDAFAFPELKMLSMVFRHGDREPNDSRNGDLTIIGRQRAYHLGKLLRSEYDDFLGEAYKPAELSARSSEYARAKMSLQLVLAGLYPPLARQRWHDSLAWQPIPFAYANQDDDIFLFPKFCPRFRRERAKVESSPELRSLLEPYKDMMGKLSNSSGMPMKTSLDMFLLYHKLAALRSMNQSLPAWSKPYFPDGLLLNATYLEYDVLKYTDWMRKINGGALARKMLDDMLMITSAGDDNDVEGGEKANPRSKLNLYSTHELVIVALLQTLKIWQPHIPAYTSAILLELREFRGSHFVKVLYYDGMEDEFREEQVPGCLSLCPLDKFIELVAGQLPSHEEMICDSEPVGYPRLSPSHSA